MGYLGPMARAAQTPVPTEDSEQRALARVLDATPGVTWFHVPNEGKRSPAERGRLLAAGLKRGVPDVIIIRPVKVALELKRLNGVPSDVTSEQTAWLMDFAVAGFITGVAYGWRDAQAQLRAAGVPV